MAWCRPEPAPEKEPHWKVSCRALELVPAKLTAGLMAVLTSPSPPAVATTTTEATRPPRAITCTETMPSLTLVVPSLGESSTPGTGDCSEKETGVPAWGTPRESTARKRSVVISPSRGRAGDWSTNSSVAGAGGEHATKTTLAKAAHRARPGRISGTP